jgi:tetratricopeptide (TPR) repeat protein
MSSSRRSLSSGPSIWEKARVPNLPRYCDLMARAHAQLATSPDAARESAALADKALPGRAAPAVVLARAALALGGLEDAAKEFARARSIDPRSVEDPATMHDLARVLVKTQKASKREDALAVYRALVPRIDLLGSTDRRVSVLLEAAHASMAVATATTTASSEAPGSPVTLAGADARPKLDEAVAYLREARQRPPTQLAGDVLLSLVLVLDRSGDRAQADAALSDAHRTGARVRSGSLEYLAAPEDKLALEALALEGSDKAQAMKSWETFLAGPGGRGPWAGAARARLDTLRKGGGKAAAATAAAPKRGAKARKKP